MMNESEFQKSLYKYLDGEMSPEEKTVFEEHLSSDPLSKLELDKERKFNGMLKNHLIRKETPYVLREKISEQLTRQKSPRVPEWIMRAQSFLKPALAGAFAFFLLFSIYLNDVQSFPVFTESVSSHMRVLSGASPLEIVSNDVNEISNWFQGKLDFAVRVPDLSAQGCKVVGARICHLKDKQVALISYEMGSHKVTAFVVNTKGMKVPKSEKIMANDKTLFVNNANGYQSILCLDKRFKDVGCVFVSDLPDPELVDLVI